MARHVAPVEEGTEEAPPAGFRLARLEVFNWGTFDKKVWSFEPNGANALLTGDIGSGKSTIVDAVTTLLLPANRISYNKAAGADTRERNLRSYVLGYHKSERNEATGTSRPAPLRDSSAYSVILGIFSNAGYDAAVTLAQVFWTRDGNAGQPDRFFVLADRELSIIEDMSDFGDDTGALKRRLRKNDVRVFDHFPDYGREFRRRLGIESDQAMDLFHQTVSMKSVGNLTEFVRGHMLEPFDAASWIERLVSHFEDLTRAHDSVLRARDQLAELAPLLTACDAYDRFSIEIASLVGQRAAAPFYFAERKAELLAAEVGRLTAELADRDAELEGVKGNLKRLRDRESSLKLERAGHGGERLGELERRIEETSTARDARQRRFERFTSLLRDAGLPPVTAAGQFPERRRNIQAQLSVAHSAYADAQGKVTDIEIDARALRVEVEAVNDELVSLRERRNNIPKDSLDLRSWLCRELKIAEPDLPYAGELIQVRADSQRWEGAAERLLRGFGLSMLVPDGHYRAVSEWINEHHLGKRLVYYRVPVSTVATSAATPGSHHLAAKLEVTEDTPFARWVEGELTQRAGYECVETMEEFRRAPRAITVTGQIKARGGRHEKNDLTRIDDRRNYVLGWSNDKKIDALVEAAGKINERERRLHGQRVALLTELEKAGRRRDALAKLDDVSDFAELDWWSLVARINEYSTEKIRIEESSQELEKLTAELKNIEVEIDNVEERKESLVSGTGGLRTQLSATEGSLRTTRSILSGTAYEAAQNFRLPLAQRLTGATLESPFDCDRSLTVTATELTTHIESSAARQHSIGNRIVTHMAAFKGKYPLETADVDNAVESASEYRAMHSRLANDDLPRFEVDFKNYLNTNTIRDIAGFHSELEKQRLLIRERIDIINESLVGIDYNPERYIRLESEATPNLEVRDFNADLRACTDNSLTADSDQYSEQKFLQVKKIIERFQGRQGHTDIDRAWSGRVTDVRNWFVFSASERWREDDVEHEHYTDSDGKSGGQKEKLAYTILAASLAYQFKLNPDEPRSRTFRFVVIDEAFGRGSDESARFALKLFRNLGMQLLIVTPLQKIHVIEPYVSTVGFVDNTQGNYSRLQTLTIEEYRLRAAHVRGTPVVEPGN